jgi:hypothetical protein
VVLFLILTTLSYVWAQAPLPVLRGIVVTAEGQGRAFFEDPSTGVLGVYAVGDVIDGNRIEQIREDAVVLRRGDEVIRILMGSPPDSKAPPASTVAFSPVVSQPPSDPRPAPGVMPADRPDSRSGPTIGNGRPWLGRLPPQALSQAIGEAHRPAQEADSDNLKELGLGGGDS